MKNYTVMGVHWSAYTNQAPTVVDAAHRDILELFRKRLILPSVAQTVGIDAVPQALSALEKRDVVGRLVLVP